MHVNAAKARLPVQPIGEPEQPVVILRILEVEDVLVVDEDLADYGLRGLELLVRHPQARRVQHPPRVNNDRIVSFGLLLGENGAGSSSRSAVSPAKPASTRFSASSHADIRSAIFNA